jgi:predicted RNase H-like HicB family nuclease
VTTYTIVIYQAEEGGYWAKVPELPGCASQGETLDELKDNVTNAIRAWLETMAEDDEPAPAKKLATWGVACWRRRSGTRLEAHCIRKQPPQASFPTR